MSYHRGKATSTPTGQGIVLRKTGNSMSISPICGSGRSSSADLRKNTGNKRRKSPLPRPRKVRKVSGYCDNTRDAPAPITDVRAIIDEPLFPTAQIQAPKNAIEVDTDAEYTQVPELETTRHARECEEIIAVSNESEQDDEYKVLKPLETYKGPGPKKRKERFYYPVRKRENTGLADFYRNQDSETEILWEESCGELARAQAPRRRKIRNREIMLRLRKETDKRIAAAEMEQTRKKSRKKKLKEPKVSSSPEMTTMRGDLTGYVIIDSDDDAFGRSEVDFRKSPSSRSPKVKKIPWLIAMTREAPKNAIEVDTDAEST